MNWSVEFLNEVVEREYFDQPVDIQARLQRVIGLIENFGPYELPRATRKHLDGDLWELRLRGRQSIARAFYVVRVERRLVIVRIFTKKSQKTPLRELRLARDRVKGVE